MRKKKEEFVFNPIAQLFSMFMRWERAALNVDHVEMGTLLHMSEAMVRAIEGARAILHPSKVFALMEACKNLELKFTMLSKMISGYQYVQALMDSGHAPQEAFQELAKKDGSFDLLYRSVHHFFDFVNLPDEQREYIMSASPYFTTQFLCDERYGLIPENKRFEDALYNKLHKLPTLEADAFLQTIKVRNSVPALPVVYAEELLSPYSSRIRNMTAIFRYPQKVLDDKQLKKTPYSFLANKDFQSMRILFLNTEQKGSDLQTLFFQKLEAANPNIPISGAIKKKVEFRAIGELDYRNIVEKALLLNVAGYKSVNGFWNFQLDTGNRLGFVSIPDGSHEFIYNLDYVQTEQRSQDLHFVWSETKVPWKKRGKN